MRILLTGATGFIGRHLLALLAGRHEVVALARADPSDELAGLATWIRCDLSSPVDASALPESLDAVVHLAQSARYREFPEGAEDVFAVNVAATAALLRHTLAAGASRFVLCSSGGVYGPQDGALREEDAVAPAGFYPASKYAAELLVAPYGALLHTVVLRPFFVYGPTQRGMLVAGLAERVLRGGEIGVDGDPGLRMTPTHVSDAARAVAAALMLDGSHVVNVAGDEVVTITDLVTGLARAAGMPLRIVRRGDGPSAGLVGDNSRMKDLLGVTPQTPLAAGLAEVVAELRAAGVGASP